MINKTLLLPAYAKINLGLNVLYRRPDGYHEVEMVFTRIALHDRLYFRNLPGGNIKIYCSHLEVPTGEKNIAYRAALLLQKRYNIDQGVEIIIEKEIPVAAGLAGGSANAATTLKALNKIWGLGLNREEVMSLGLELGADVPYCIHGGTCLAQGIGEVLTPLPSVPQTWVVLAKPQGGLSTAIVYQNLKLDEINVPPNIPALLAAIKRQSVGGIAAHLGNVLQTVSEKLKPQIACLQKEMLAQGVLGSIMTGSGPTVFGLTRGKEEAEAVGFKLRQLFPDVDIIVSKTI